MRADLKHPEVGRALDEQERRAFLSALGKNDQALHVFSEQVNPRAADFLSVWGWDITTIAAVAYLPELELSVVIGPFDRDQLIGLLAERGKSQGAALGYDRFWLPAEALWVAVGEDAILLTAAEIDLALLDTLLQAHAGGGAANHPAVQALLAKSKRLGWSDSAQRRLGAICQESCPRWPDDIEARMDAYYGDSRAFSLPGIWEPSPSVAWARGPRSPRRTIIPRRTPRETTWILCARRWNKPRLRASSNEPWATC